MFSVNWYDALLVKLRRGGSSAGPSARPKKARRAGCCCAHGDLVKDKAHLVPPAQPPRTFADRPCTLVLLRPTPHAVYMCVVWKRARDGDGAHSARRDGLNFYIRIKYVDCARRTPIIYVKYIIQHTASLSLTRSFSAK
jgi:hypothetical protein